MFVEMMTHQAGAKTVVVGGRPQTGPMQAVSGSRGALEYSADELDEDISFAGGDTVNNQTANATLPQVRDPGVFTNWAGFTLRDQIRENDNVPLQFKYLAAECRLYYTLANIYNMSQLWRDVATAAFDDQSLCVEGSQGYASSGNTTASKDPPTPLEITVEGGPELYWIEDGVPVNVSSNAGLQDGTEPNTRGIGSIVRCGTGDKCNSGTCREITVPCQGGKKSTLKACVPECRNRSPCQVSGTTCQYTTQQNTKARSFKSSSSSSSSAQGKNLYSGFCIPTSGNPSLGCSA